MYIFVIYFMAPKILEQCTGFDWDQGNTNKNYLSHDVTDSECEEVFFNRPFIVSNDEKHSTLENRYYILGRTDQSRFLFISFAIRNTLIRVISARDMTKREEKKYYERIKRNP